MRLSLQKLPLSQETLKRKKHEAAKRKVSDKKGSSPLQLFILNSISPNWIGIVVFVLTLTTTG